jgi:flagellar hook-associated protein 2
LTKLQSQDTAISSLGTLVSNLSNDMSSLTDFTGVMAEKEGSSSDENVLKLTAATSSTISGTHTVIVKNLAATSSGYLTQIANANDPLTGSITLQAGSGTQLAITLNSSDNTLSALANTINSSGIGINASVLTDAAGSMLSLVSNTSGANGNISVTNNTLAATDTSALTYTNAKTVSTTAPDSGTLTALASASDTVSGSISIQSGSGTTYNIVAGAVPSSGQAANTIYTGTSVNTLSSLENVINLNTALLGATALVNTAASGSNAIGTVLTLTSTSNGTSGKLTVSPSLNDITGTTSLAYTNPVTGADANLTVDGVDNLTSSSNTVANLIPGVTFQLLAPSTKESDGSYEQVQVIIANDNSGVESAMSQLVSDYNSLMSAVNTQEGLDSSNNAEPLFGSPTLSLLQQQLLSGLNMANPNGTMTSVASNTNTTLTGSMSITMGKGSPVSVVVGAGTNTASTIYTGTGSGYNTISGLAAAINAAGAGTMLTSTVTPGTDVSGSTSATASSATLTSVLSSTDELAGRISVAVGSGKTETIVIGAQPTTGAATDTIYTGSGINTLSGLAGTINANSSLGFRATVTTASNGVTTLALNSNAVGSAETLTVTPSIFAAGLGFTANVVTSNNQSTLTLASQTQGSSGALTVSSAIVATSDTALAYTDTGVTSTMPVDIGTLAGIPNKTDALSGSITLQVGSGQTQTIAVPAYSATSPSNNLAGLAGAINKANIGVNATVIQNTDNSYSLQLQSETLGSAGDMTVTSKILDATNTSSATLSYTNSSDINSMTTLGISVNNDGTLTFDEASLDSVLNSDFSSVVGFFQNSSSWGQSFSAMLTNSGNSSPTGVLSLASTSNSNIESTLNADISREEMLISAESKSLTTELNSANETIQNIPSELSQVNQLYSAITGYNQNQNG